ncbi:uncharacterized protein LOC126841524 [Adelges cooleyi]|uniref:uncharacterized protein LOC126841524 n=1 Tax=Adelges cooleyi TaxID=133065 RepID=UPI00217F547E|nr:uncharacterized protein LOC126841524 [Adelges cooleyi]
MYSKNTILYFCVTLYFLQCQSNEVHRQKIEDIVNEHYKQGSFGYENFISVIDEVKKATGAAVEFPSLVEMEMALESRTFLGNVLHITQGNDVDGEIMGLLRKKFKLCELKPYGINFDNLRDIIIKARLAKRVDNSTDVKGQLRTDLFKCVVRALNKNQIIAGHLIAQ